MTDRNRRVVVTGFGAITSLGHNWDDVSKRLRAGQTGIRYLPEWEDIDGLRCHLGGPVLDFEKPAHYSRKQTRSMGRVALLSTSATETALSNAGLLEEDYIRDGRMGISYGSCSGSTKATAKFASCITERHTRDVTATTYVEMMSHTSAVNAGVMFGLQGRVIPTTSACTSGSQGIGYAYEAIKFGKQQLMVAGGAEELCPSQTAVFDTLFATSQRDDRPSTTPRPFDQARDGLVIGEGACSLILEDLEHAQERNAQIYAEIVGFATNSDGQHITAPSKNTMETVIRLALDDASLDSSAIGYVNAHGTATDQGDIAESHATQAVFGKQIPISSLKGHFGHTLGACGAIEAWLAIEMMNNDWYAGTANLDNIDPECAELDYLTGAGKDMSNQYVMSNNFAFGGINTSLIFKRFA